MAFSENTFKNYYYAEDHDEDSDDREGTLAFKVKNAIAKHHNNIDDFFETPKKKKKLSKKSSSIARASYGGVSYVSSNKEDAASATHLVKIEIFDMSKIKDVAPTEQWKHADVRVKYYTAMDEDKNLKSARDVIYNITKQVASDTDCVKYFIDCKK